MGRRSFWGHKGKNVIFNTIRLNVFNGSVALLEWVMILRIKRLDLAGEVFFFFFFFYLMHYSFFSALKWHLIYQTWLTGGNWQKWKRVFLTCPFQKIYRDEAVGLKSCKYTWKITKFVKMWNLVQYPENLIFCQ